MISTSMNYRKIEEESERIAMETIHIVKKDLDSKTKLLKEVPSPIPK